MTRRTRQIWGCTLLLLLLAVLLIPRLNNQSLWGDEGWSVRFAGGDTPTEVTLAMVEDRHPPLYFLLLFVWRNIAGDDLITLRALTAFIALITGALLYRLGKGVFHPLVGGLALFLYVLLDKQTYFSLEVRHYSLLMLWTVAATLALGYVLPPAQGGRHRWRPYSGFGAALAYVVACIGGLYTHSFMVLVIAFHGLYILTAYGLAPRLWRRLLPLYIAAGVAFLPWALVTVYQYRTKGAVTPDMPFNRASAEILAPQFFGTPVALMAGLLLLGLFAARVNGRARWLPALGILFPLGMVYGLTTAFENISLLNDRNISLIIPFMLLLMGLGLARLDGFGRGVLVMFLLINSLFTTDVGVHNPPWRPMARFVASHAVPGQPVFLDVGGEDAALSYHLSQVTDAPQISIYTLREADPEILTPIRFDGLNDLAVTGFWYIYWGEVSPIFDAFDAWGYARTYTTLDYHVGNPIYMHRYDLARLTEQNLTAYGDTLRLHQVAFPDSAEAGESLSVGLWWSAEAVPSQDYSVSVFLLNEAGVVPASPEGIPAQHDGFPQDNRAPTTIWEAGRLYYDPHTLPLPESLPAGNYRVAVKVYFWGDGSILRTTEGGEYQVVGEVTVR